MVRVRKAVAALNRILVKLAISALPDVLTEPNNLGTDTQPF